MDEICPKTPARFQTNKDVSAVLCAFHISFARRVDFGDQSVRRLEKGSFPTIDVAVKKDDLAISERERRTVSLIICNDLQAQLLLPSQQL